jgi:hypothetical protein
MTLSKHAQMSLLVINFPPVSYTTHRADLDFVSVFFIQSSVDIPSSENKDQSKFGRSPPEFSSIHIAALLPKVS